MLYQYFTKLTSINQSLIVVLLACISTIAFGKKTVNFLYSYKIGQPMRFAHSPKLSELHEKKISTPTMGGALSLLIFACLSFVLFDWKNCTAIVFLLSYLLLGFLGAYDDLQKLKGNYAKGISSKGKFFIQIAIGLLSVAITYFFDKDLFFSVFERSFFSNCLLCGILFFIFVFCGSSNAVNLTDGLDGLAAGNIAIVSLGMLVLVLMNKDISLHQYNSVISLSLLTGLSIGFLWFNNYPAQMFMGDTGSLSYGGLLGCVAFFLKKEWFFAFMGLIFVVEALSVILQVMSFRLFNKRKIFLCAPIHHHFQYQGFNEVKIVTRFWIVSILLVLICIIFDLGVFI